ncbi:hypothetical protein QE152_g5506 [Popillia japonica]|uniref:Uncharacterized protein n=1 Tax=Popillia japonica TaxID=7064 RepID=A0AAW1MRE5_POPJA
MVECWPDQTHSIHKTSPDYVSGSKLDEERPKLMTFIEVVKDGHVSSKFVLFVVPPSNIFQRRLWTTSSRSYRHSTGYIILQTSGDAPGDWYGGVHTNEQHVDKNRIRSCFS